MIYNTSGIARFYYYDAHKFTVSPNGNKNYEFHTVDVKFTNENIEKISGNEKESKTILF